MDFYKRMELVCQRIPRGKVASYGQIALLCGMPRHARQVGYALGKGLAGAEGVAHRIVNARGILSGAAAFESPDLQKRLLEQENVVVERMDGEWICGSLAGIIPWRKQRNYTPFFRFWGYKHTGSRISWYFHRGSDTVGNREEETLWLV